MEHKRTKKMDSKKKIKIIVLIIFILIIIASAVILEYKMKNTNVNVEEQMSNVENTLNTPILVELEEEKIKTFSGDARPIAVMIDNHKGAQPQGGLNDAYIVYEMIAEGGESRLMAVFKGANTEKIGPIRSSRHYYLDYAFENDAIYVHYGWSPQAQSDISALKVENINGITESEKAFWRTKDKSAPHNVATSIANIMQIAEKKGYRTTSKAKSLLNYKSKEVNIQDGQVAQKITIPFSDSNKAGFTYDEQTKTYNRYTKGIQQKDWTTGEYVTTKNIIITFVENYPLQDVEKKDRQTLNNIGTFKGYYITNGQAMPITCTKNDRKEKTIYKDLNGKEIEVNDGRTFIEICPIDANVVIE